MNFNTHEGHNGEGCIRHSSHLSMSLINGVLVLIHDSFFVDKSPFGILNSPDGSLSLDQIVPNFASPISQLSPGLSLIQPRMERYSRKVFVGGLPPDIDEGLFST